MKITWITRSFLDYRIPVYAALNELCGDQLTLIYNEKIVPERVNRKIKMLLKERAIGLTSEKLICGVQRDNATMANRGFRIPYQKGLISKVIETSPDVMISDGFFQWTYAPLWVRFVKKIPHVMCYERTMHTERNAGLLRTLYRKAAMHLIDAIDCNGILTSEYVTQKLGYSENKLTYGHMTADTSGLKEKMESITQDEVSCLRTKLNCKSLVYLYVGQIIPRKGIIQMLNAWKLAELSDSSLLLVGTGKQFQEIEQYIRDHAIRNVILVGSVDYDELAPYYKLADCFIISTLEDNWSLVVPEAMACGLPVLCSIYNGCWPELIRKNNGWTFDPLNSKTLVDVFHQSYSVRDRLSNMGRESQKLVANYSPQHAAEGIFEACMKVCTKK